MLNKTVFVTNIKFNLLYKLIEVVRMPEELSGVHQAYATLGPMFATPELQNILKD